MSALKHSFNSYTPHPQKPLAREGRNLVRVLIQIKAWEMTAFYTS